ncbi:MAG: GntR family transcriptional regulator [Pseudolabrys sp.]|nr:GntR family transcriptional regulator [Pseudolabrys sp.]MDP2299000.1 GntR family transcriptional regulator [Pseudolabrys sp.]
MEVQAFSPADLAYARIKGAILNLTYKPGQRLSEAMLSAELGLGRSPIRTALTRLEGEGWIKVQPQSGTFVSSPTAEEVAEMAELREVLEAHAARRAAKKIDDATLKELRAAFDTLTKSGVEGHFDDFLAFDDLFHSAIHRAAGNRKILEMIRNLRDQIQWVRVSNAILPGRVGESLAEMKLVLEALERRNERAAAEAMSAHIGNIATRFQSLSDGSKVSAA